MSELNLRMDGDRGFGRVLAHGLDRLAFASLLVLAVGLAMERAQPLLAVGPMVVTNVEGIIMLVVGLWALALLTGRRWPHLPAGTGLPVLVWVLLLLASAMLAPANRGESLKFVARMLTGILLAWTAYDLIVHARGGAKRWQLLGRGLALGGALVALLGLAEAAGLQAVTAWLAGFKLAPTVIGDVVRVSSTLAYATIAAMILELTLPLVLAWTLTVGSPWQRFVLALLFLAGLVTLALTLTRAGLLGLMAALGVMLIGLWRFRFPHVVVWVNLAAAGALIGMTLIVFLGNPTARLRLLSESDRQWYLVDLQAPASLSVQAGRLLQFPVTVANKGVRDWYPEGERRYALSYHLLAADDTLIDFDGYRTFLPGSLLAGGEINLEATILAPREPGRYTVVWDMVHEQVTWFSWKGGETVRTSLVVLPQPGSEAHGDASQEGQHESGLGLEVPREGIPPSAGSSLLVPAGIPLAMQSTAPPGRLELWSAGISMLIDRPLLGVGPDNFRHLYGVYAGVSRWDDRVHANSLYVEWLANTGVLGFLAFLWLAGRIVWVGCRRLRTAQMIQAASSAAIWQLALLSSMTAWFVHGLLDQFYEFTPTYVGFWLVAALLVAGPEHGEGSDVPAAVRAQAPLDSWKDQRSLAVRIGMKR